MAKKDKEILENIRIETVAAEGNALAHVNGKALFVPMAIPGDIVRVQITHKKKSYMQGYMLELVTPSPMRLKPFCTHFGNCGGCHWQSIPYDKQLEFKQQQVIDQLTRIGKLDLPTIIPILGSEKTVRYRNKLEFTFSNSRWVPIEELRLEEGAPLPSPSPLSLRFPTLGFHVRGRFDKVLDIDTCYLQEEPSNAIRLAIRDYAITKGLSFFDLRQQTGFLRTLMIRTTLTGQVMVVVVFAHDNLQAGEDHAARKALLDHLQRTFPQITSLHYVINTKRNDSLGDQEVIHYAGKPYIVEQMEDLQFRIGPKSFYQTNSLQALQ
ncbi:MAG: TRAM domain-containing protein, partial [Bacteroidales bacterium]